MVIYVCEMCGSEDISTKAWVNPNSGIITGEIDMSESQDNWCEACQEHVNILEIEKDEEDC